MRTRQHFLALDGLRGVAAFAVLVLHATDPFDLSLFPAGGLAVDFFFVLSGFVIAHAYEKRLLNGFGVVNFIVQRAIRLFPLIIVGCTVGALVAGIKIDALHSYSQAASLIGAWLFGSMMIPSPFLQTIGNDSYFPLNIPAWSLFFELVINLIYAAFIQWLRTWLLYWVVIVSALALAASIWIFGGLGGDKTFNFLMGFSRVFFSFSMGVLLFRLYRRGLFTKLHLDPILAVAALVFLFSFPAGVLGAAYYLIALIVVFPMIVGCSTGPVSNTRLVALFYWCGRLSYPVYVLQYPFLRIFSHVARYLHLNGLALYGFLVAEILFILLVSLVVLLKFDEPVRREISRRLPLRGTETVLSAKKP